MAMIKRIDANHIVDLLKAFDESQLSTKLVTLGIALSLGIMGMGIVVILLKLG